MITQDYLLKLRTIISQHPQARYARELLGLVDAPYANQKSLEQLHSEINLQLHKEGAKGTLWARIAHNSKEHHESLKLALTAAMNEALTLYQHKEEPKASSSKRQAPVQPPRRPSLIIDEFICTPEQFNKEFFLTHVSYTPDDERTVLNNAIMEIIEYYEKHHKGLSSASNERQKEFHRSRLTLIHEWTSVSGYQALMQAINQTLDILTNKDKSLSILPTSSKASIETQNTLNWLGIIYEHFYAGESPHAMREALKIIGSIADKDSGLVEIIHQLNQFIGFYIGSHSVAEINIDDKSRVNLLTNMIGLQQIDILKESHKCREMLVKIQSNLKVIYEELSLFILNQDQFQTQYHRLISDFDSVTSQKYFSYFDKALGFRARSMEAKANRETRQSYEPLACYGSSGLYFTPHEWRFIEGDAEAEQRRLSIRSNSSRKSKDSHSDRSNPSDRSVNWSGDQSPSLKALAKPRHMSLTSSGEQSPSMRAQKPRNMSIISVGEQSPGLVAARLGESSGSSKSTLKQ